MSDPVARLVRIVSPSGMWHTWLSLPLSLHLQWCETTFRERGIEEGTRGAPRGEDCSRR